MKSVCTDYRCDRSDPRFFRSSYPHLRRDLAVSCRTEVEQSPVLTPDESRAVMAGNALKLFPRFTAGAAA